MKIMCNIITGAIKDLAKQIGRSESYTCNLVSVWQTQNNANAYPTAIDLQNLIKANKEQAWDIYFAVPNYNTIPFDSKSIPITHKDGQITLMLLPKDNPLGRFFSMFSHLPELKTLVNNTTDAYRFILWREMAFMQYGLAKESRNKSVAEGEALKKLREWRKRNPVVVQQTTTPTKQNVDLSAYAEMPFDYEDSQTSLISEGPMHFTSVEQALQIYKFLNVYEKFDLQEANKYVKALIKASSVEAKQIVDSIPMSEEDSKKWEKEEPSIRENLIRAAYEQNTRVPNSYEGKITPSKDTIFVFGSNPEGRHGAGAAQTALVEFGAKYHQGEGLQGNSYALPTKRIKRITPIGTGKMTFSYGNNKRSDVESNTTFEAIINGERIATTRYLSDGNIDYWKSFKVGDIIAFSSKGSEGVVYVRITKPLTQLTSNTDAEEWSKKEGWSVDYYNKEVKPKVEKGEAYQMEYEFVDANGKRTVTPKQIIENIRKMYQVATENPDKKFKVAYTNAPNETTLNGYSGAEMIQMFKNAGPIPANVLFSKNWTDHWNDITNVAPTSQVAPTAPTTTSKQDSNTVLSFSVASAQAAEKAAQEKQIKEGTKVISQAEANDVYNIPNIGTEHINVNENNPLLKLVRDFTATQRYDRVRMLARNFSDVVDASIQEKLQEIDNSIIEERAKDNPDTGELARLKEQAALFNHSVEGRRAIIKEKTLQGIFKQMREDIESYLEIPIEELDEDYGNGAYIHDAYQKVLDNWDELLKEACTIIEGTEHLRININKHSYHNGETTEIVTDGTMNDSISDTELKEEDDEEDDETRVASGNSGWSFQVRFVDPAKTLSKKVKGILNNIKKEGTNGQFELDDLGNTRYLNGEFAHVALLNELASMTNADDFSVKKDDGTYEFPALKKAALKYPWVNQVINALAADPSIISSFYADLRKDFVPYWIQYFDEDEGKWKTKAINQSTGYETTKNTIINNYEQGSTLDEHSLYDAGRNINNKNAQLGVELANNVLSLLRELEDDAFDDITDNTSKMLRMVGLRADKNLITGLLQTEDGVVNLTKAVQALRNIFEEAPKLESGAHLINSLSSDFNTLAEQVGLVYELDYVASVRNGKKTYYSYVAPNYLETLFKTFKDDKKRDRYLQSEFGQYTWFKNPTTGQWNSEWLHLIETDEDVRDQIAYKNLLSIGGIDYSQWGPSQIKGAFIREYFSAGYNKGSKKQFAWYNLPIFSDSPVTMMVKFLRYTNDNEGTFKEKLLPLFNKIVKQELERIKLVQQRVKEGKSPIANFDENGSKFCFFPELNSYMGGRFLEEVVRLGNEEKNLNKLDQLINTALEDVLNGLFDTFLNKNNGEFNTLKESFLKDGTITSPEDFRSALEEYFWNQAYATTQIIELTVTDLVFSKDDIDFQKRFKQVYAAGTKLNTNSQYGRKIEKTIYLRDQVITSSSYVDIKTSLDRAVKLGHIKSFDRDNILHKFRDVNVTDAQAYRSLSSMRAILDMMGLWTPEMENAINRFNKGKWGMSDFNLVWQTIKPFMYTQVAKPDGFGGKIKVPHQNKNSEFLLLSVYGMVANTANAANIVGKSAKLKAINSFMEKYGIDVVQFETAVKSGGQGIIDISYSKSKLQKWINNNKDSWKAIVDASKKTLKKDKEYSDYEIFKAGSDVLLDEGKLSQEDYNNRFSNIEPNVEEVTKILEDTCLQNGEFDNNVVHELPYDDYVVQQPTPEHLFDTTAVAGSQFRNLNISDMPDDPNFRVEVNGQSLTKQEVLRLYQSLITENLLDDWDKVKGKFANIRTLQKALLSIVEGNLKYGKDIIDALQIVEVNNPNTGEKEEVFNIPLDNPTTTNKIQEITSSMFKNTVTKQRIKGASCILVSDFGLTHELQVVHGKDGRIKYMECYLPAYSKKFYKPFMVTKVDKKGNTYQELDIKKMPEDLKRIIGYRIPTEDKYSMAPLMIKGFLPQENGSSIMLPADITTYAGSDFDVDKMYLMIPEFEVLEYDKKKAREDYAKVNAVYDSLLSTFTKSDLLKDTLPGDKEEGFNEWFNKNKDKYKYSTPKVVKVKYDMSKSPQEQTGLKSMRRKKRNNMIIDISWSILTHPDTAEKIHNPGNFDKCKIAARIASIMNNPTMLYNFAEANGLIETVGEDEYGNAISDFNPEKVGELLLQLSKEGNLAVLDSFIKKYRTQRSQLTVDTFIYNHKQNMTGAALISIFANNTSMQAKYQTTGLAIKDDYTFFINNKKIQSLHDIISADGERISKNCANFSAASVDGVKDPVLADLMQNKQTAYITGFMLRAGLSIEEIGLLFSQPLVKQCIDATGSLEKLGGYVDTAIKILKDSQGGYNDNLAAYNPSSMDLMMNCLKYQKLDALSRTDYHSVLASNIQSAQLMLRIRDIANDLNKLTTISRADSPNGAIEPSIAGAKRQIQEVNLYMRQQGLDKFTLTGLDGTLRNEYITADMSRDEMRKKILNSKMPLLQAFYSLGIEMSNSVLSKYYSQANPYTDALIENVFNSSQNGIVSAGVIDKLYKEVVEFALSKTKLFGDDGVSTFDEKRDYYLYDYPQKFLNVLAENPDLAALNLFKKIQVKNGTIVSNRSGRFTPLMREILMRDFDILLNDSENPAAQKLAIDLFMYSYYKEGFKFGPNSFGMFFSSNFISSFPEVVNTLRTLKYGMHEGSFFDEFLSQFYANNWKLGIVPPVKNQNENDDTVQELPNGTIAVYSKACLNKNLVYKGVAQSYPMVTYKNSSGNVALYELYKDGSDRAIYTPAVTFTDAQKGKRGVKYNANMTVLEMQSITPNEARVKANAEVNPVGFNYNPSLEDSDIFMSFEEGDAILGGITADTDDGFNSFKNVNYNSLDAGLESLEQADPYNEEDGQSQLDEPMCKA